MRKAGKAPGTSWEVAQPVLEAAGAPFLEPLTAAERRAAVALALMLPRTQRPTYRALARLLGVSEATVRRDACDRDVVALSRRCVLAAVAPALAAAARAGWLAVARRAAAGDLDALRALTDRLDAAGAAGTDLGAPAPEGMPDAATDARAELFASPDAAADLAALLGAPTDPPTPPGLPARTPLDTAPVVRDAPAASPRADSPDLGY